MSGFLEIFRALADSTRLRIMHLLGTMELSVGELAQALGQSQPRVSRHVKILAAAGLIERRKEGNWVFLRIGTSSAVGHIKDMLDDPVIPQTDDVCLTEDRSRLAAVRSSRREAADAYFAQHAAQWDAIRSLYVPEAKVEQAIAKLLDAKRFNHLVDLGTGTGRMIELFGAQADRITAIDRSADMLRVARSKVPDDRGDDYHLTLGDFCDLPLQAASVDLVTAHQILHYSPTPEQVIIEAARVLVPDGLMLVADFAPHEREELRTRDRHERLGFSDDQMKRWFTQAGLTMDNVMALPGGELTVKIWLGRRLTPAPASTEDA